MGKNKAQAPTLPRIRYMCFDLTHAPVAFRSPQQCYQSDCNIITVQALMSASNAYYIRGHSGMKETGLYGRTKGSFGLNVLVLV